jgi:hypothetical protein
VLYFIPIFFLFEPALIFQGPILNTDLRRRLRVAILVVAGASEGMAARLRPVEALGEVVCWRRRPADRRSRMEDFGHARPRHRGGGDPAAPLFGVKTENSRRGTQAMSAPPSNLER